MPYEFWALALLMMMMMKIFLIIENRYSGVVPPAVIEFLQSLQRSNGKQAKYPSHSKYLKIPFS